MNSKAWLLAGLVLVAGIGLVKATAGASVPKIGQGARILVMGDSLGVGLTTPLKGLAQNSKGVEFSSCAVGGTATFQYVNPSYGTQYASKLRAALESFRPTLVLVSLGTNDAYGKVPAEVIAKSAADLIALLKAAGAQVVWIGPPRLTPVYKYEGGANTLRPEIIDLVRDVVTRAGVPWFDSTALEIPQFDGIHATVKGYSGWAGAIWQWLGG